MRGFFELSLSKDRVVSPLSCSLEWERFFLHSRTASVLHDISLLFRSNYLVFFVVDCQLSYEEEKRYLPFPLPPPIRLVAAQLRIFSLGLLYPSGKKGGRKLTIGRGRGNWRG